MTTKEVLQAAKERIANPDRWCQGSLLVSGQVCSLGAIAEARGWDRKQIRWNWETDAAVRTLASVLPPALSNYEPMATTVSRYNDLNSHECVIAAFDAAIERCGS